MMKGESSQSEPIPLLTIRPGEEGEEPRSSGRKRQLQLQLVTPSRSFKLPEGWLVEEKPRPPSSSRPGHTHIDKVLITPRTRRTSSSFVLPDGWEVEEKPRSNINYSGYVDRYYIEPGTRKRFRSLLSVERYLTEANEDAPLKALMPANKSSLSPGSGFQKMNNLGEILSQKVISGSVRRNLSGDYDAPSNPSPPAKVNWVLGGPGGNMWNAFMDDSKVPDSVKQKWSETFVSSVSGENVSVPRF
ncbi:methyl-CpG-binding domain-containing protein 7-like isoform X2 [Malus domestica]|uniref:methyl-CpG-binding domain-containing protein 7-like isoform X2 n=1 Tax=Malus domestica TaxID=3750 RepID=UPI00397561B8